MNNQDAPIAQLDRAPDYGSGGWGFNSLWAHSFYDKIFKLEKLYRHLKYCNKCRLYKTRKNVVCGEGNPNSLIFFIAQAPGQHEDKYSRIFIGPAGEIFNKLLKISLISRKEIFITNLVKCVLPKYRRPKWDEIEACKKNLFEELEIVKPKIVVPLGYYSTKVILKKFHFPVPERRNQFHEIFGKEFKRDLIVFPVPHPALIFHDSSREKGIISAFKNLGKIYQKIKSGGQNNGEF